MSEDSVSASTKSGPPGPLPPTGPAAVAADQAEGAPAEPRCLPCEVERADPASSSFSQWVTRLVHDHRAHLARVARREGLLAEDAFDAVQEAFGSFLLLPQARELVASREASRRFLVTLTRNVARNRRRLHAGARPHLSDDAVLDALPDAAPGSDRRLESREEQELLARCVGELGDAQRAVVTLRMLDEVPGEDVARMLGIAPGNVAVLLHRAKARLATCMAQGQDDASAARTLPSDHAAVSSPSSTTSHHKKASLS
jgi:RNA polymerase sigma-70 factor (ECF subfamily)